MHSANKLLVGSIVFIENMPHLLPRTGTQNQGVPCAIGVAADDDAGREGREETQLGTECCIGSR